MLKVKRLSVVLAAVLVFLAACSPAAQNTAPAVSQPEAAQNVAASNTIPDIRIDAADYSYTAPETITAGWVRVYLTNSGQEPHHVQFLRLNDGVTMEQFKQALEQGEGPALALTQQLGGVGAVAPAGSAQALLNLTAGEYVILCLIPSPSDHIAHFEKGMLQTLTVQPASGAAVSAPTADLTVRMADYSFDLPDSLPVKPMTIEVINDGPEPHELNILRLADGKTADDVLKYLGAPEGAPPFTPVGGMNGLDVGKSGYILLDLPEGNYAAICNIPSPKAEGHPHFTLGMIQAFSVGEPVAAAPTFPIGKFVSVANPNNVYEFREDLSWSYYTGGLMAGKGTYAIDKNLWIEQGTDECLFTGTYEWSWDGTTLSFKVQGEDRCDPRREATDGQSFTVK